MMPLIYERERAPAAPRPIRWTARQRAAVVLAVASGRLAPGELERRYGISPARCKQLHEFPGLPIEIRVFCRSVPVSAAEQFPFTVQREFCQETPVLQRQSDHDANAITGNKDKIPDFSKQ